VGGAVSLLWCIPSCLAYIGRLARLCWLFLRVDLWSKLLRSDDLASFESDILELMGDVLPSTRCSWDWTSLLNDDSLVFLCSPPLPPPVPIRWITSMNTFLHPSALDSASTPLINYVAISHPVLLQWCSLPINYVPGPIGWCTHRLLCRLTLRHEQALDLLRASFSHSLPVSTSMDTFPLSLKDQFIASFNPASTSMQWLLAEQMDSRLLCRSVHHNCFSVDLKTSCHQSVASMSGFSYPAMMESVMNSFENGHCTPLIVDLGASCCIMPHCSNFMHYTHSSVKIKDLSGVNTVAG
jgi:hypothetical protein